MKSNFPEWINNENHTGGQYPYYFDDGLNAKGFTFNIEEIINDIPPEKRIIEPTSVVEILHKGYIFGDKTLIQGVKRAPWKAVLNNNCDWEYSKIAIHGYDKPNFDISSKVKKMLYRELLSYIGDYKRVGILLSGGLDSRIIAGILREAQMKKDYVGDVVVYNWGMLESRDVIYAKKIADLYDWQYIHYSINPDSLKDNFFNSLMVGAEISPVHLHRVIKIRDDLNSDIIIAGTYGDSLGRGQYSGTHVSKLKNLTMDNLNKLGLFKENFIKDVKPKVNSNYFQYEHQLIDEKMPFQLREVEQNIHYLRRLLATAMSVIAQRKPIYQLFTSPEIVNYIWNLDYTVRNDDIYKGILKTLPKGIGDIPYAKTGRSFITEYEGDIDNYYKSYHQYGFWLRNELRNFIEERLDLNLLYNMGIFNESSLERIISIWPKANTKSLNKLDNTISWLTVFSMFINRHKITIQKSYRDNLKDRINAISVVPKIQGYQIVREKLRK